MLLQLNIIYTSESDEINAVGADPRIEIMMPRSVSEELGPSL